MTTGSLFYKKKESQYVFIQLRRMATVSTTGIWMIRHCYHAKWFLAQNLCRIASRIMVEIKRGPTVGHVLS